MNFEWNGALAERQERVAKAFADGKQPSIDDWVKLKRNWMVRIAELLAPSNLVVRHYCLLDLLSDRPEHACRIMSLCEKITCADADGHRLWSEGYSYWGYTCGIMKLFVVRFYPNCLIPFMAEIDLAFQKTAHLLDGKPYPVPLGDIWDDQMYDLFDKTVIVSRETIRVHSRACGFNLHTEHVDLTYMFDIRGVPIEKETGKRFVYYHGYKEKYPTKWKEIKALLKRALLLISGRNH